MRTELEIYPQQNEWAIMKEQAAMLLKTSFLPQSIRTPEEAIAIMLKGRELNMPVMQSFSHINIIKGKPGLSAEGMLALIFKQYPGCGFKYIKNDNECCVISVTKPGNPENQFTFTLKDAKTAGIMGNPAWRNYPRAMLRSRCVSEMARSLFPECLLGNSYTPEEISSFTPEEKAPEIIQAEAVKEDVKKIALISKSQRDTIEYKIATIGPEKIGIWFKDNFGIDVFSVHKMPASIFDKVDHALDISLEKKKKALEEG